MCGQGCDGGDPPTAFEYWVSAGVLTSQCVPYPFAPCAHHVVSHQYPPCPQSDAQTPACDNGQCTSNASGVPNTRYFGSNAWTLQGESDFMQELYQNGPFGVAFSVYSDFPAYKGGIYKHTYGSYLGGHAVEVVGWGTENGVKYWKIKNSWNAAWGMNGYFKILRGSNECGIEQAGSAGAPASSAPSSSSSSSASSSSGN